MAFDSEKHSSKEVKKKNQNINIYSIILRVIKAQTSHWPLLELQYAICLF